ncbi:MAG: hypothetical protein ABIP13_05540 [Tepidiformaceae bacterium]
MAFVVRWWQSFLQALSLRDGAGHDAWVEPGNRITRTVLSGAVTVLPVLASDASSPDVFAPPLEQGAEEANQAEEIPAEVAVQAPAVRPRKRGGHRAA